jgi:large subunit ribosomal protein L29
MKAADLREKSVEDLRELQKTLAHDVFQNRLKNFTNRLDDTSSIRKNRRDLARVITLIRERQSGAPVVQAKRAHKADEAEKKAEKKVAAPAAEAKPKKTAATKKPAAKTAKKSEAK